MSKSKFDRWMKISNQDKNTIVNPNKRQLLNDLSTIPEDEMVENMDVNNEELEAIVTTSTDESESESDVESMNNTHKVGVKEESISDTAKSKSNNKANKLKPKPETVKDAESENLIQKVNQNVISFIENKTTKEDTHRKTSFLLTLENLVKLDNFDKQHGGRVKGEFINNLLEEAFAELEEDPRWHKILNNNLEKTIEYMKSRRRNSR